MNTLNASLDQVLEDQVKAGSFQTKEEVTQELLQILIERDIDKHVSQGATQIDGGLGIEVTVNYRDDLKNRIMKRLALINL
ncbi:MAG: hypothetical protein WAW36_05945 [Methylovulum miyakonense]|uniref:hypothetical protein n=1 Tax=Methylovulum miyakonense TaxID=645578 RepID=UPI003BB7E808